MKIAIRRLEGGEPKYVVAQHYNVCRSTISRLWQRYLQTGTSNELVVRALQLCNRIGIYVFSIYATGQLRQHRLLQAYLVFAEYPNKQYLIPCEKPDCEPDDLILVRNWTLRNWRGIWFSEESRYMLQHEDCRIPVYRRKNEHFANDCVLEVDRFGRGSDMM